jgi:RNA polymerase sigma factor (sigma-70 family)
MDLVVPPGDEYFCGELLGASGGGGASLVVRRQRNPVKGVKLKKRILAQAGLEPPRLDPDSPEQVKAVLASCPEYDPNTSCVLRRFSKLFFQHPLFTGTGQTLLRWLRIPCRRDAYLNWLAELYPEAAARSRLRQTGVSDGELWLDVSEDVEFFLEACYGPSGEQGMPVEPFPDTLRAFAGGAGYAPSPEQPYLAKELRAQVRRVLATLTVRERDVLVRHLGLLGSPEETLRQIGRSQGVLQERIRQIEAKALRKLRHPSRAKHLEPWS